MRFQNALSDCYVSHQIQLKLHCGRFTSQNRALPFAQYYPRKVQIMATDFLFIHSLCLDTVSYTALSA
jgi:hypothetical protein